jgi:hypothetical protein
VVRWSTRRNRYERQGILAEPAAIEQAAQECLSDADLHARRRTRERPTALGLAGHMKWAERCHGRRGQPPPIE